MRWQFLWHEIGSKNNWRPALPDNFHWNCPDLSGGFFGPDLFAPVGLGLLLSLHFLPRLLRELMVTGGAPVGLPERLAGLGLLPLLRGHGGSYLGVEVFVGGGRGRGQHQLLQGHDLSL